MKKICIVIIVFWWALIFPEISLNSFTTNNPKSINIIKDDDLIFQSANYTFWLGKILSH